MTETTKAVDGTKPATAMDESKRIANIPQPPCICTGICSTCGKNKRQEVNR